MTEIEERVNITALILRHYNDGIDTTWNGTWFLQEMLMIVVGKIWTDLRLLEQTGYRAVPHLFL